MERILHTIANALCTQGIIKEKDIDTCRYGLDIFISSFLELFSIIIISGFIGNLFETFLFFLTFVPLRVYAGGYHANTRLKCYLISLGVYGVFTTIIMLVNQVLYTYINVILSGFSLIMVLILAPVIHSNKSMNEYEKRHYRKFSIIICIFETFVVLLLTVMFPKSTYIASAAMGQVCVTLSMAVAVIKRKIDKNKSL